MYIRYQSRTIKNPFPVSGVSNPVYHSEYFLKGKQEQNVISKPQKCVYIKLWWWRLFTPTNTIRNSPREQRWVSVARLRDKRASVTELEKNQRSAVKFCKGVKMVGAALRWVFWSNRWMWVSDRWRWNRHWRQRRHEEWTSFEGTVHPKTRNTDPAGKCGTILKRLHVVFFYLENDSFKIIFSQVVHFSPGEENPCHTSLLAWYRTV